MRIGQLVANVATWKLGPVASAFWDIKDDDFIAAVDEHLKNRT